MFFRFLLGVILTLMVSNGALNAQSKYWIFLKDKGSETNHNTWVSSKTLLNREMLGLEIGQVTDVPVYRGYLDSLSVLGVDISCKSKWLNAVSTIIGSELALKVEELGFVTSIERVAKNLFVTSEKPLNPAYPVNNYALEQTNSYALVERGLTGKGVSIGVIDGNFYQADKNSSMVRLFDENKVVYRDFIDPDNQKFFNTGNNPRDIHASVVWQMVAGYDSINGVHYGLATGANFYLARTDERYNETLIEEDRWVQALEWLDSLGVRLVHSSLGYSNDFDNPEESHTVNEMDGETTIISRAAKIGVEEKGMIIVTSAGNEGKVNNWKVVSAPADVKGVIAVGATSKTGSRMKSSSIGSEEVDFLKPDLACFSQGGTSIAAPIVTGIVACLLEVDSTLTQGQVMELLQNSASLSKVPNNSLGYGIPDASLAMELLVNKKKQKKNFTKVKSAKNELFIKPKYSTDSVAVVFHKRNKRFVILEEELKAESGGFTVKRVSEATYTTLMLGNELIEIFWKR